MSAVALPPTLVGAMARFTAAALEVTGPAAVREELRRAMAGQLREAQTDALAAELDALAVLLASR